MQIQVAKMPGRLQTITAPEGATVGEALTLHTPPLTDTAGYEIRIGGRTVSKDEIVVDGDRVLLVREVKGNEPKA